MGYAMSMIDTLKAANTLKENGFNERQADAIVSIVREREDRLATKQDLDVVSKDLHAVEQGLKQDIALLRNDFGHLEKATKENNTVVRWMIIISITLNATALVGIIALFLK